MVADIAAPADAFALTMARADMDEARAVAPARPADKYSDVELARRLAHVLFDCADRLGMADAFDRFGWNLEELAREVVLVAQGGKLPPSAYRAAFTIWQTLAAAAPTGGES